MVDMTQGTNADFGLSFVFVFPGHLIFTSRCDLLEPTHTFSDAHKKYMVYPNAECCCNENVSYTALMTSSSRDVLPFSSTLILTCEISGLNSLLSNMEIPSIEHK